VSKDRFRIVTGPIREGASPVHVYNDGLVIFLFDDRNTDAIRQRNPEVVWSIGEGTFEEPETRALVEAGDLVVCGMEGDGSVDAEVVVGPPLDDEELATGLWRPRERTLLRVPSGRLWVHSYNTLPMGDNGEHPEDEGGLVRVPPADYVVTAYRKDWNAMEGAGICSLDDAEAAGLDPYDGGRIDDVFVLTPVDEAPPLAAPPGVLFRPCLG